MAIELTIEVGVGGELVMFISPGLEVVAELKVVERGPAAVVVAFPKLPVVAVNACVASH